MNIQEYLYKSTYPVPIIKTEYGNKYMIYADSTGSGYQNWRIDNIINNKVKPYYSNTHSNSYCSQLMSHYIEQSRNIIKKAINASENDKILFYGYGMTACVQLIIHMLDIRNKCNKNNSVIFITQAEHNSNYLPWLHINTNLIVVPLTDIGAIDEDFLIHNLNRYSNLSNIKYIYCSFNAGSNLTGIVQNIPRINAIVHSFKGKIFWDLAAYAPYLPIKMNTDIPDESCDGLYISVHKFFGGGFVGMLVIKEHLICDKIPYCGGGGSVTFCCRKIIHYSSKIEQREIGGSSPSMAFIQTGLAFDFKEKFQDFIEYREMNIIQKVNKRLRNISNIKIYNPQSSQQRIPTFIFQIKNVHYNLIVKLLDSIFGIQTRGGISCSPLLSEHLLNLNDKQLKIVYENIIGKHGTPKYYGFVRVSFNYVMPDFIIDYICYAIEYIAKYVHLFESHYKYLTDKNIYVYVKNGQIFDNISNMTLSSTENPNKIEQSFYVTKQILDIQIKQALDLLKNIK